MQVLRIKFDMLSKCYLHTGHSGTAPTVPGGPTCLTAFPGALAQLRWYRRGQGSRNLPARRKSKHETAVRRHDYA